MTSRLRRKHLTTVRSTRWATPLDGSKAGGTRGTASLALIVLTGIALVVPPVVRADGHLQQWSKPRKDRQAVFAAQSETAAATRKLKWQKAPPPAVTPSTRAVGPTVQPATVEQATV